MNPLVDLLLQPIVRAGEWLSLASGLPRMVGVVSVAMILALLVAVFLQAVLVPVGEIETAAERPPLLDPPSARFLLGEHAAAGGFPETGRVALEPTPLRGTSATVVMEQPVPWASSFTRAERRALTKLKERMASGEVEEYPLDVRRLEFFRWLVKTGRFER